MDALVTQRPEIGEYYTWDCVLYPCYTTGLGLSPNGEWAVFFAVGVGNDGGLYITRVDGEKQWKILNSDITGYDTNGVGTVSVEHWSFDGKFLYLAPSFEVSGGYGWFWGNVHQLIRLDLRTGNLVDMKMNLAFSFSPNDRLIAYRGEDGVHIHDITAQDEQVYPLPLDIIDYGHIVWSPDSSQLIFVAAFEDLSNEREKGFTVFMIDLRDGTLKAVFENDKRYIYPSLWAEPNTILFDSLFEPQRYILDPETNQINPVNRP